MDIFQASLRDRHSARDCSQNEQSHVSKATNELLFGISIQALSRSAAARCVTSEKIRAMDKRPQFLELFGSRQPARTASFPLQFL
jgi:hypothetical protein